jgi:hypothetical protein
VTGACGVERWSPPSRHSGMEKRLSVVALAVVTVLGATLIASGPPTHAAPSASPSPSPAQASQGTVPAGWRVESSVGVEVAVPADWVVNDYGCGMTGRSTIVRHGGESPLACLTPEPPTKQVAQIERRVMSQHGYSGRDPYPGLAERSVVIDGVPGTRAEGTLDDGRHAGWIWFPTREIAVLVKTRDPVTTRQILDSVRLVVGVDGAGCETRRPAPTPPPRGTGSTFVTSVPTAISICHYGSRPWGSGMPADLDEAVEASVKITGDDARQLATLLNAAPAGANLDALADECRENLPVVADVVLHLWVGDTVVDSVWIAYASCTQRGLYNGASRAQMSHSILRLIARAVHAGYHVKADIPR